MIKRSSTDINLIIHRINKTIENFLSKINNLRPTENDLVGTIDGILRLQSIYHLKTVDLINGIIDGNKTSEKLKPHDILTIAREASRYDNQVYLTDEYLIHLKNSLKENKDIFNEVEEVEIEKIIKTNENFTRIDPFKESYKRYKDYSKITENKIYSQACRQKLTKSPKESKNLFCRYISNSHFSSIAPFKMVEMDHHANLVIYIDVISDEEIKIIKEISREKFTRAGVVSKNIMSSRTSQISWFKDDSHEVIRRISKRVEVGMTKTLKIF